MPTHPTARAAVMADAYPRPQLVRDGWVNLDGPWAFAYDDADRGLRDHWERAPRFEATITVPFPPESPASGVGDSSPHRVLWYHRVLTAADVHLPDGHDRLLLHVGAADQDASVWVDGHLAGHHEGGQTPFSFDITDLLTPDAASHDLVVRCVDDHRDVEIARGKQDWREEPHAIWYERTSGIWQTVWLETVPACHVDRLAWTSDIAVGTVTATVRLATRPAAAATVQIEISHDGQALASCQVACDRELVEIPLAIPALRHGQAFDDLLWSPSRPVLLDATVTLTSGDRVDTVQSYLGLRSVAAGEGRFFLNDWPWTMRSVLSQGYWPDTHLAAKPAALRAEVELITSLGFNAVRIHQKVEDPRFLFWCDQLGLTVWGESAAAYAFSPRAVARFTREWIEVVERDRSHPCVIAWVPLNESWGVPHVSHDKAQEAFVRGVADLTRALDPTRPVVSNDGWEHAGSDIVTIHDYTDSPDVLRDRYGDPERLATLLAGIGPVGRRMAAGTPGWREDAPAMLTEFGGIAFRADPAKTGWGYSSARDAADFEARLVGLVGAARECCRPLSGFCYTQLTDTRQEMNGLADEQRRPKLPAETIRAVVTGRTVAS